MVNIMKFFVENIYYFLLIFAGTIIFVHYLIISDKNNKYLFPKIIGFLILTIGYVLISLNK